MGPGVGSKVRARPARRVEEAIHRYFRAIGDLDVDAWVACFDQHGVAFSPSGGLPAVGRAALRKQAEGFLGSFDELYLHLEELHASADSAAARWDCRAVVDGHRVDFAGVDVFEMGPDQLDQGSVELLGSWIHVERSQSGAVGYWATRSRAGQACGAGCVVLSGGGGAVKRVIAALAIVGGMLGMFGAMAPPANAQIPCIGLYVTIFGDQIIAQRICL